MWAIPRLATIEARKETPALITLCLLTAQQLPHVPATRIPCPDELYP